MPSNAYLRQTYGITLEDYNLLLERQDHDCAICDDDLPELVVDHQHRSHTTRVTANDVRGLLCQPCNKGLGHFFDSTNRLKIAIDYLYFYEEHGFPWNGYDACYICGDHEAKLFGHNHPHESHEKEWRGDLCHNCLTGMRFFRHRARNLRWAIAYLVYYGRGPRGAYWRNADCKPFPSGIPEGYLYGDWAEVRNLIG